MSADITLSAGDVGAYTKAEIDTKVADAKKAGTDAQATANAANTAATNKSPKKRSRAKKRAITSRVRRVMFL